MSIETTPLPRDGSGTAPTPQEMREAMSSFASGVTIVSGVDDGEPVGFACQSFASVSLEPPLVLFCADHRGRAWPRIRRSGLFNVSVLAEDQSEVCARFGSSRGRKFEGLEWQPSPWGTPVLGDVLLRVHCAVEDVHVAGDHDVVIGRVLSVEVPENRARPMIFFRGKFGVESKEPEKPAPDLWGWGDHWG
ncbi:flavin reductase [Nocardioides sp. JQ2195]|uniref:flavin reductase family protein n=1 Tax=Nocardioides sp. JQ2195 TaxID=2592334 RepID=UPI00143E710E|nr:flavin reductase family protein [Nocardioides sp. JQ2195]QIX26535.1 flavin reductase [Nocardioides sp. JQ2195]